MRRAILAMALGWVAAAAWGGGNVPGKGELGWYGYVRSVESGGGKFTVEVAQWRTARDTGCLNPTQARAVAVGAGTEWAPLGAGEGGRRPGPGDLRAGRKVYVLGPEPGSGGALHARWVALEVSAAPAGGEVERGTWNVESREGTPRDHDYEAAWLAGGVSLGGLVVLGGVWWMVRRRRGRRD